MLADKLRVLAPLTALALTGCPEEDDGGTDTNAATVTMTTASTNDTEEETESATTEEPMESSSGMMSTSTTGMPESTSGMEECTEADDCITAADCPMPETDMCIGCLCVGGDPMGSDYGPCDMCAAGEMPVGVMDIEGCWCAPSCDGAGSECPAPNEGTAIPACALGMDAMNPTLCGLICPVGMDGICPTGATCQDTGMMDPMGNPIGICTHPA